MAESWASAEWTVKQGSEDEFVSRWNAFLSWTKDEVDGFDHVTLIRSVEHPHRFVSFAHWKDDASREAWKSSSGFAERFAACRELCSDFFGGDFEQVSHFAAGA